MNEEKIELNLWKFVMVILIIIFLGSLFISYNNGFSNGFNDIRAGEWERFKYGLDNVYECNVSNSEKVMFREI